MARLLERLGSMHVRDIMTREVVTLLRSDRLHLADDIMRLGRIRHLPVTDGDQVVGILSQRDLFRAAISSMLQLGRAAEQQFLGTILVQAVMTPAPLTIGPDASIRSAVRLMLERKIGCLPVVEAGRLVGLVSEADCLRHLEHVLSLADAKGLLPELTEAS
jgi:CBS domain-containing protein